MCVSVSLVSYSQGVPRSRQMEHVGRPPSHCGEGGRSDCQILLFIFLLTPAHTSTPTPALALTLGRGAKPWICASDTRRTQPWPSGASSCAGAQHHPQSRASLRRSWNQRQVCLLGFLQQQKQQKQQRSQGAGAAAARRPAACLAERLTAMFAGPWRAAGGGGEAVWWGGAAGTPPRGAM